MEHLTDLIEYLESNHHYAQVDEMMKIALDMTDILEKENELGDGSYGRFYSNFTPEQKQKIKNQLGHFPDNIGIKKFKHKDYDPMLGMISNIKENLTFIYISPYINQKTDLITPVYTGSLPLSAMITHKISITQKMTGETLNDLCDSILNGVTDWTIYNDMEYSVEKNISQKLHNIGVTWTDCHSGNYLINKQVAQDFREWAKDNIISTSMKFDLSKNASLFDFGLFTITRNSPPGQQLLNLRKQMMARPDNKFTQVIAKAIGELVI